MNPTSPDISGDQWLGCSQLCSQIFPIHPQILPTLNLCRVDISSPKSSCEAKAAICMLMPAYACLPRDIAGRPQTLAGQVRMSPKSTLCSRCSASLRHSVTHCLFDRRKTRTLPVTF